MANFLDRVRTYSYLDKENGQCGRTGNFTYIEPTVINDPIYIEMIVSPNEDLSITAYRTDIAEKHPNIHGGYELYQSIDKDKWDIELKDIIGSVSVCSRVNRNFLDELSIAPEFENTGLREVLLKTTDSIGHFLGWKELYVTSDITGQKKPKVSAVEKVKSTFDKIKERLSGHKPAPTPEYQAKSTVEILDELGYTPVNSDPHSNEVGPMVGIPSKTGILQPDILETLAGRNLRGKNITKKDNFTPRFQFVYRIMDKDLNDLMASHSLHY